MPDRAAYETATEGERQVEAVKLTEANSGGFTWAPKGWAGREILVLAAPDWWEVRENPDGVWVEWEGGEKATDTLPAELDGSESVYVGRGFSGATVLLVLLEDPTA